MRALSRDEVRDVDRRAIEDYGLPGVVLMENAGRNAAQLLAARVEKGVIAIVCGKGNNAGDGFVMARHLENLGREVRVLLASAATDYRGDAAINLQVVQRGAIPIVDLSAASLDEWSRELSESVWIVDALLGTGLTGEVRSPLREIISAINASGRPVFAVDLPSGMDADIGRPLGVCIKATTTATFVARKRGFDQPESRAWTGDVHVLDIGVPRRLLEELDSPHAD